MAHKWHTLAQNGPRIKNSSFDSPDLRQRLMECSPWPWKYMEIQRHGNTALRRNTSRAAAFDLVCPDFHRGDGVGPTQKSPKSPKSPKSNESQFKTTPPPPPFHTPHSQLQIPPPPSPQSQRVDSSLRPTTETAGAGKGRGPRFSSGRRSRANPKITKITKITKIKRITVQDRPPHP